MSEKLNAPARAASILDEIWWEIESKLDPRYDQAVREFLRGYEDKVANALIDAFGKGMEEGVEIGATQAEERLAGIELGYIKV